MYREKNKNSNKKFYFLQDVQKSLKDSTLIDTNYLMDDSAYR